MYFSAANKHREKYVKYSKMSTFCGERFALVFLPSLAHSEFCGVLDPPFTAWFARVAL